MFKGLTITAVIFIILIVFGEIFLPTLAERNVLAILQAEAPAEKAVAEIKARPAFSLLFGRVDGLHIQAKTAMLGKINVTDLDIRGGNIRLDMAQLLSDKRLRINSADKLTLHGTIREDALAAALQKKVDKIKDVAVEITPETVKITGNVPLAGRKVDVAIEGNVVAADGGLYFHLRQVNIRNALLGKALVGNLFEDIMLADLRTSPFQLEATDVVQKAGAIVITLNR